MLTPDNIPFAALATLLDRIAAGYRQHGITSANLSERDFYRVFGTDEMFDVYAEAPSPIGIGSLRDDILELGKLLENPDSMPTPLDIERLGNVLRAISEVI